MHRLYVEDRNIQFTLIFQSFEDLRFCPNEGDSVDIGHNSLLDDFPGNFPH